MWMIADGRGNGDRSLEWPLASAGAGSRPIAIGVKTGPTWPGAPARASISTCRHIADFVGADPTQTRYPATESGRHEAVVRAGLSRIGLAWSPSARPAPRMNSGGLMTRCVVPARHVVLSLSSACPAKPSRLLDAKHRQRRTRLDGIDALEQRRPFARASKRQQGDLALGYGPLPIGTGVPRRRWSPIASLRCGRRAAMFWLPSSRYRGGAIHASGSGRPVAPATSALAKSLSRPRILGSSVRCKTSPGRPCGER